MTAGGSHNLTIPYTPPRSVRHEIIVAVAFLVALALLMTSFVWLLKRQQRRADNKEEKRRAELVRKIGKAVLVDESEGEKERDGDVEAQREEVVREAAGEEGREEGKDAGVVEKP